MTDVVAIFDSQGNQLIEDARPIKVSVIPSSKMMEHPLEDGSSVVDHRVIQPTMIEVTCVATQDSYQRIKEISRQNDTVIAQTNAGVFESMAVESYAHDETSDVFDKLIVQIKLREVIFVKTQFQALPPRAVKKPRNASTVKNGSKRGESATDGQADKAQRKSKLAGLSDSAADFLRNF